MTGNVFDFDRIKGKIRTLLNNDVIVEFGEGMPMETLKVSKDMFEPKEAVADLQEGDVVEIKKWRNTGKLIHVFVLKSETKQEDKMELKQDVTEIQTFITTIIGAGEKAIKYANEKGEEKYIQYEELQENGIPREKIQRGSTLKITMIKNGETRTREKIELLETETKTNMVKYEHKTPEKTKIVEDIYKQGGVYSVGRDRSGKEKVVADAGKTQKDANENGISTEIKEIRIIDKEEYFGVFKNKRVIVIAKAIRGNLFSEASCELELMTEIITRFIEILHKVSYEGKIETKTHQIVQRLLKEGATAEQIFQSNEFQVAFAKEVSKIATFLVRICETKAQERAQKRLLNQDFRDQEEIESEDREVRMVNEK